MISIFIEEYSIIDFIYNHHYLIKHFNMSEISSATQSLVYASSAVEFAHRET